MEFLAEKELVTITPNFSENKMSMISVREQQAYLYDDVMLVLSCINQLFMA